MNAMDVFETRQRNLLHLLQQLGARGITKNVDAAQALGGLGASYLSQLKAGKRIGEETARKIERALHRPQGWMDLPQWMPSGVREDASPFGVDVVERLMGTLPPDERALLENYRAATEGAKAMLRAAAEVAGNPAYSART